MFDGYISIIGATEKRPVVTFSVDSEQDVKNLYLHSISNEFLLNEGLKIERGLNGSKYNYEMFPEPDFRILSFPPINLSLNFLFINVLLLPLNLFPLNLLSLTLLVKKKFAPRKSFDYLSVASFRFELKHFHNAYQ